jgi:hypothetical protein
MAFDSREFEFADIRVSIFGTELTGLRGITFKKTQEKEPIYGAGNEPVAIQSGNIKYEGTLTLLQSNVQALLFAARKAGYNHLTDVPANQIAITVVYNQGLKMATYKLMGVAFTEFELGMKQGDKYQEVELPFLFTRLIGM